MSSNQSVEHRLTELEIKASFTEDQVDQLDQIVARQQRQIDVLMRQLAELRQPSTDSAGTPIRHARDELPPHY